MIPKTLPEGWKVVKLGEICKIESGNTAPQGEKYFKNGKYPFIRMQHLNELEENKYVKNFDLINEIAVKEKKMKLFKKDSILLAKSGESIRTEKKAMLKFDSYVVNHLAVLQVINEKTVDKKYLYYFFKKFKLSSLLAKTTTPSINLSTLKTLDVLLPPLTEQKKIAEILSTVDKAIQKVDEAIEKTERLKKGLMQRLLTKGIGHKEFKYSKELGYEIPKEWEVVRLKKIAEIRGRIGWRGYKRSDFVEPGKGAISLGANNITEDNKLNLTELTYVSWEKYYESPEIHVKFGDIIMAQRGSLGKVAIIDRDIGKATINPNIVLIKNIKINNFYLYYVLASPLTKKQVFAVTSATTVPLLTQQQIKSFKIPLPPLPEQQKIAEILSTVDKKLEFEKKRKEKLERIKKGLMNDLLTGRKRVKLK